MPHTGIGAETQLTAEVGVRVRGRVRVRGVLVS